MGRGAGGSLSKITFPWCAYIRAWERSGHDYKLLEIPEKVSGQSSTPSTLGLTTMLGAYTGGRLATDNRRE